MQIRKSSMWLTNACALAILASFAPAAQAAAPREPLAVSANFELDKFAGSWFEIARTASFGRRLCTDAVAGFEKNADYENTLDATFTCAAFNATQSVSGVVSPADDRYPATLLFTWSQPPVRNTDFYVLAHDDDYTWALVGDRKRENAYVYAREASIDPAVLRTLIIRLNTEFDYARPERSMHCTKHSGAPVPGCNEILND